MQRGFSLVELSIVLVILGLLTGGILGGQSLMHAAELRAITTEYNNYISAVHTFRDKYFALPGDMTNAEAFWGTSPNCPGTTAQGTTDGTTCDGDGDGQIEVNTYASSKETYRAWQHLASAGLIEGTYNGVSGPGDASWHAVIGTNVPKSKFNNSGWTMRWIGPYAGSTATYVMDYGHTLDFGGQTAAAPTGTPTLTPEDLWNIDTKIDDGRPAYGKVIAHYWNECTDATTNTDLDSEYLLSESGITCSVYFRNIF